MKKIEKITASYYGENGTYLEDHARFLTKERLKNDIHFISKILSLKKTDKILDIACGQGRHTLTLAEKGYSVDGLDFSEYLLDIAKKVASKTTNHKPFFYKENLENMELKQKYDKAYWFFTDLAQIDLRKALHSISNSMKRGGLVLIDTDNIFRILTYLLQNPGSAYTFDAKRLMLVDKKRGLEVPYPVLFMWEEWIKAAGFSLVSTYGDYKLEEYSIKSPRLIMLIKKNGQGCPLSSSNSCRCGM